MPKLAAMPSSREPGDRTTHSDARARLARNPSPATLRTSYSF